MRKDVWQGDNTSTGQEIEKLDKIIEQAPWRSRIEKKNREEHEMENI